MSAPRSLPLWVVIVCSLVGVLGLSTGGSRVVLVRVSLLPGASEPSDPSVLGLGKKHKAPDYRLELLALEEWVDCGTKQDTPMGEGLDFEVPSVLSPEDVSELRLVEVDKLRNDELERLFLDGKLELVGERYRFELQTERDMGLAIDQFVGSPLGLLVTVGLAVGLMILMVGRIRVD